jgi:hypothetical protein
MSTAQLAVMGAIRTVADYRDYHTHYALYWMVARRRAVSAPTGLGPTATNL